MKTTTEVSTKTTKDADAIVTTLSIDWEGLTQEELVAIAQQALIVKLQSKWRKDGTPKVANIKATDYKVGTRTPKGPVDVVAEASKLTPEERAALIAKLKALG